MNDDYLGSGIVLKESLKKYGRDSFISEILEFCNNLEELNRREFFWIREKQSHISLNGYNLTWGGDGGDTFSSSPNKEKTRKSRSESISEYWKNLSDEDKEERIKKIRGKKRSAESRKRISEGKRGYKMSETHLLNMKRSLKKAKAGKPTYNQKAVIMYDLCMNYLNEFDSIHQAARETGHNAYTICKICKEKQEKIKNHIFRYKI